MINATEILDELSQFRLENDWTFDALAEDMARKGKPVSRLTLQFAISGKHRPYDRTLHKIKQYLDIVRAKSSGRKRVSV